MYRLVRDKASEHGIVVYAYRSRKMMDSMIGWLCPHAFAMAGFRPAADPAGNPVSPGP
jgi:hypothetical protein